MSQSRPLHWKRCAATAGVLFGCTVVIATPAFADTPSFSGTIGGDFSANAEFGHSSNARSGHRSDGRVNPHAGLRRIGSIECSGNQRLRLQNVLIQAGPDGIDAKDQCRVELINSYVVGQRYGIRMGGKSTVILRGTHIEGARAAVRIGKTATLAARSSRFVGDMERLGPVVDYRDRGGNVWDGVVRTTPLGQPGHTAPRPFPQPPHSVPHPSCEEHGHEVGNHHGHQPRLHRRRANRRRHDHRHIQVYDPNAYSASARIF